MARRKSTRNTYRRSSGLQRSPLYTMHARAAKKRSENMHRAGAVVLLIIGVAGAVWLAATGFARASEWLFSDNDQFTIRKLDISSTGVLTDAHIKEFGKIKIGANLFALDIGEIRDELEKGPMVKQAEIQRKLPDTLVVRVTERVPLARIAHGRGSFYFTVDEEGHVLKLAGERQKTKPIIKGHGNKGLAPGDVLQDGGVRDALKVISMCDNAQIRQVADIASIDVSFPEFLDVILADRRRVWLPRNPSRNKILDMVRILQEAGRDKTFFDMTIDRNIPAT